MRHFAPAVELLRLQGTSLTQPTAAHALLLTSLSVPSTQVLHFGPVGSGMAAKLVNQALVCVHAQAAAEAIYLAEHMGLLRGRCVFTRPSYKPLYRPLSRPLSICSSSGAGMKCSPFVLCIEVFISRSLRCCVVLSLCHGD